MKSIGIVGSRMFSDVYHRTVNIHNLYDVFPSEDVPRAREDKITHLGGQKSPKSSFGGVVHWGMDLWGDDAAFYRITSISCFSTLLLRLQCALTHTISTNMM